MCVYAFGYYFRSRIPLLQLELRRCCYHIVPVKDMSTCVAYSCALVLKWVCLVCDDGISLPRSCYENSFVWVCVTGLSEMCVCVCVRIVPTAFVYSLHDLTTLKVKEKTQPTLRVVAVALYCRWYCHIASNVGPNTIVICGLLCNHHVICGLSEISFWRATADVR